jgi:hypothetical protein
MATVDVSPQDDDSREWIEATTFGGRGPVYVPGPCQHPDPEPIVTVAGETVGWLCVLCHERIALS